MNKHRSLGIIACALLVVPSLSAETFAIAVRQQSELEAAPILSDLVEQGAMEYLFGSGHIVFDLDLDPADPVFAFRAIDAAENGGAAYVVLLELVFTNGGTRDTLPDRVEVIILSVQTEEELGNRTLHAEQLERYNEMTPDTVAVRLGAWAARIALESMEGGSSGW